MSSGQPDVAERLRECEGATQPQAILVGGCSRSGTTMLGAMLGAAEGVVTVPEAEFKWTVPQALQADPTALPVQRTLEALRTDWKFRLWDLDLPAAAAGTQVGLAALMRYLTGCYTTTRDLQAACHYVDHTPGNIRFVPTLARVIPDARFVHIIRDGRAVAASVLPLDWGPSGVLEAARYWASQIGMGLAAEQHLPADRILRVRYEDLVGDPAGQLRRLCAFLGLTFHAGMVTPRSYDVGDYTRQQHRLVGAPADPSRIDAWRQRLSRSQVEMFEHITSDLLVGLGYDAEFGIRARRPTKLAHMADAATAAARRLCADRVRRARRRRRAGA